MASSSSPAYAAPVAPAGDDQPRLAALVALFARHPVAAGVAIWFADVLLVTVFNLAAHAWTPPASTPTSSPCARRRWWWWRR